MDAKFLLSTIRVVSTSLEDSPTHTTLRDGLFIVRKTDAFAHMDMARLCNFRAQNGGFIKRLRLKGQELFYGESFSCGVSTDESMQPLYRTLMSEGRWWKTVYDLNGQLITIFCVVPTDFKPSSLISNLVWEEAVYEDVYRTIRDEYNKAHGIVDGL